MRIPSVVAGVEFRREAYGLNSSEWAKVLGMSRGHYSEFINGKRDLPRRAMARAYEFGVPADVLFQCAPSKHICHIQRILKG